MDNDLIDNDLKKPCHFVKLDSSLIPLIMECFGDEVEKIEYPDNSIEIILKDSNDVLPPF